MELHNQCVKGHLKRRESLQGTTSTKEYYFLGTTPCFYYSPFNRNDQSRLYISPASCFTLVTLLHLLSVLQVLANLAGDFCGLDLPPSPYRSSPLCSVPILTALYNISLPLWCWHPKLKAMLCMVPRIDTRRFQVGAIGIGGWDVVEEEGRDMKGRVSPSSATQIVASKNAKPFYALYNTIWTLQPMTDAVFAIF